MKAYSKLQIKETITPADYLTRQGYLIRRSGASYRGPCPFCDGSNHADKFKADGAKWHCKACGLGGDIFTLVQHLERISFGEAVEKLGSDAGLTMQDHSYAAEYRELLSAAALDKKVRTVDPNADPKDVWGKLSATSVSGEAYLHSRGILPTSDVRYGARYACLQLVDMREVVNVVGRLFSASDSPKAHSLAGCSSHGVFCCDYTGQLDVLIVEGVFDYLTARQVFPESLVIGAHGATGLTYAALTALGYSAASITILAHNDNAGAKNSRAALELLIASGVQPEAVRTIQLQSDLNDLLVSDGSQACRQYLHQ